MSEIKTNFEFPRGDDSAKFLQRLVQDLSKNFKSINLLKNTISQNSTTYGIDGVELSGSFSIGHGGGNPSTGSSVQTLNHNIGTTPRGFILIDLTATGASIVGANVASITRTSWTSTQITIRINTIDLGAAQTISGTYKILVLR